MAWPLRAFGGSPFKSTLIVLAEVLGFFPSNHMAVLASIPRDGIPSDLRRYCTQEMHIHTRRQTPIHIIYKSEGGREGGRTN